MSPAFGESAKSHCRECEHRDKDKKKYPDCVRCEKRFGNGVNFLPENTKPPYRVKTGVPCKWPHGCTESSAQSEYCAEHQRIRGDRRRRYKKKGIVGKEVEPLLNLPIRKGPNRDTPKAMKKGGLHP